MISATLELDVVVMHGPITETNYMRHQFRVYMGTPSKCEHDIDNREWVDFGPQHHTVKEAWTWLFGRAKVLERLVAERG